MEKWGWFSADEDGKVVAKTEVQPDGKVDRYPYTKPDDIKAGHGDEQYKDMKDFIKDKKSREPRDKDDPASINRKWFGNGYDLALETLDYLSKEELQYILELTARSYTHTSEEMLVSSTSKKLILK